MYITKILALFKGLRWEMSRLPSFFVPQLENLFVLSPEPDYMIPRNPKNAMYFSLITFLRHLTILDQLLGYDANWKVFPHWNCIWTDTCFDWTTLESVNFQGILYQGQSEDGKCSEQCEMWWYVGACSGVDGEVLEVVVTVFQAN